MSCSLLLDRDRARCQLCLLHCPLFASQQTYTILAHLLQQVTRLHNQDHRHLVHWFRDGSAERTRAVIQVGGGSWRSEKVRKRLRTTGPPRCMAQVPYAPHVLSTMCHVPCTMQYHLPCAMCHVVPSTMYHLRSTTYHGTMYHLPHVSRLESFTSQKKILFYRCCSSSSRSGSSRLRTSRCRRSPSPGGGSRQPPRWGGGGENSDAIKVLQCSTQPTTRP